MMLSKSFASFLATLAAASSVVASITPGHMPGTLASCYFEDSSPHCCKVVQQTSSSTFLFFVGGDLFEYTKYGPANLIGYDCRDYTSGDTW